MAYYKTLANGHTVLDLGEPVAKLKISVTDFAQKNQQSGDIDESSGIAQVSPELGIEIHREIQDRRAVEYSDYRRELPISGLLTASGDLEIDLSGRIDGAWTENNDFIVEDIKSTLNVKKLRRALTQDPEHEYILQVKTYGWLLWRQRGVIPQLRLLLVAAGSREEEVFRVEFDPHDFSEWIERRQKYLEFLWAEIRQFKAQRKKLTKALKFPFARKRTGQSDLIHEVESACKTKSQLIIQAPTGMGKTAGVLFPLLKSGLRRGDKVFYVTPKNSQLREAESFLKSIALNGEGPLGLIMTSKPKICMNTEVTCNPKACPFAKGHYDKVNEHKLISALRQEPIITADVLRVYATRYEVCPYELSKQLMPWVDLIAGDYHYALSPQANLREIAKLPLVGDSKPLLAIDEAHNLAERALDWYSHEVTPIAESLLAISPKKVRRRMQALNEWLHTCLSGTIIGAVAKRFDRKALIDNVNLWSAEMPLVLEAAQDDDTYRPIVECWFSWMSFRDLCQLPDELFFPTKSRDGCGLTLNCVNAGPLMRDGLTKYQTLVAFSATMKPFSYHQTMAGFCEERVVNKEFVSPFPREHRKIIVIPQISTAWRDRPRNLNRIVEVIERVSSVKRGNYIAFFPSFELLRQALSLVKADGFEVVEQPVGATVSWVQEILDKLRKRRNVLLFAVQGGVLSEGIDLPGDQLIGAFIIGPALSMITTEREERRKLLRQGGADGYALTYGYPAMAKSIQSAGRVIRSSKDRGLIVLMDPRFLKPPYSDAIPADWIGEGESTETLISQSILSDIASFWSES
jgi:DNA excision repair protein ERCC-2